MYESKDKMVSHPAHYQGKNGIEVIDVIESFTSDLQGIEATDTGNIIKYACRWKQKGGVQDLEKIMWYTQHLIDHMRGQEPKPEEESLVVGLAALKPEFNRDEYDVNEKEKRLVLRDISILDDMTKSATCSDEYSVILQQKELKENILSDLIIVNVLFNDPVIREILESMAHGGSVHGHKLSINNQELLAKKLDQTA